MLEKKSLSIPYPEIIVDRPNLKDVRCIMNDYSGKESEFTAISQYMYQAYVMGQVDEKFHLLLEGIAISEMTHHEMLAEAIIKLGGNPIISGTNQFWCGSFVNYTQGMRRMLMADIHAEKTAIANYKRSIKCVDTFSLKEMLERIILDEELHITLLEEMLMSL